MLKPFDLIYSFEPEKVGFAVRINSNSTLSDIDQIKDNPSLIFAIIVIIIFLLFVWYFKRT